MRFTYLDGIRGIAALFVVTRHWHGLLGLNFRYSHLAVDLFFILSGFVIAHGYDERLRNGSLLPRSFMVLRLVRFYPVFTLSVVACVSSALIGAMLKERPERISEVLVTGAATLFFIPLPTTFSPTLFALNVSYWSLLVELIVNAGYACLHPHLRMRMMAAVVAGCALILVAVVISTGTIGHGYSYTLFSFTAGLVRAVFGIGLGIVLYRQRARWLPLARRVSAPFGVLLVVAVLAFPAVPGYSRLVELAAVFVILPAAVAIAATSEPSGWSLRVMAALGAASYPLYLLHVPAARIIGNAAALAPGWERPLAFLAMPLLLLLCVGIDRHFDVPVRRQLHKWVAGTAAGGVKA